MAGSVAGGRDGADRGAGDHIGLDAVLHQRADDADMGKAAGGAARERKPDRDGLAAIELAHVGGPVVIVGHVASQDFQHGEYLRGPEDRSATGPAQGIDAALVNRLPAERDREADVATYEVTDPASWVVLGSNRGYGVCPGRRAGGCGIPPPSAPLAKNLFSACRRKKRGSRRARSAASPRGRACPP